MQETATAEELKAAEESKAGVEPGNASALPLQIVPPPVQLAGGASSPATPVASEDVRSGPTLFWQKLAKLEMVKPGPHGNSSAIPPQESAHTRAMENNDQVERSSPAVHPVKQETNPVKEAMGNVPKVARERSGRREVKDLILSSRKFIGVVGDGSVAIVSKARAKMLKRPPWGEWNTRIGWGCDFIVAPARNATATVRHSYRELKAKAQARFAGLPRAQRDKGAAEPAVKTPDLHPIARRSPGTRIFTGLPLRGRVALARLFSHKVKLRILRRDSRLWTSVAMAGLSAALAFGFISTVRHYATQALPSHVLHSNSFPVCTPAEAPSSVLQKSASRVESVQAPNGTAIISPKRKNTTQVLKPKPRHSEDEDDDYVARDTYVSYGNRRNGSR